jgi:hypothetical protein
MKVRTIFASAALVILSLAGCKSSPTPEQDLEYLPPSSKAQTVPQSEASPVVLSKNGHEVMYIKCTYPGSEGMTSQQIEWSKAFGTYEDLQKSVALDQGKVWVGTVVTLADSKCTETTSSIAEIPKVPGEPKMKVVSKLIPCPAAQVN